MGNKKTILVAPLNWGLGHATRCIPIIRALEANGFIPLVGNSIVIIKAPLAHKVTPVMKPRVPRKTIQIFVTKGKNNESKNS